MARITVEDCLEKEPNRFALVLLAAKRTKQLLEGARVMVGGTKNKPIVNALREIAEGQVRFMTEEDKAILREREEREREAAREAGLLNQPVTNDITSIPLPFISEIEDDDDEEDDEIEAADGDDEDDAGDDDEDEEKEKPKKTEGAEDEVPGRNGSSADSEEF